MTRTKRNKPPAATAPAAPKVKLSESAKKALAANMVGRARLMQRMAGIQYNGKRDVYAAAGYIPQDQERFDDYWGLYCRGDIAGRIVDMPARTTWRTPPDVVEDDNPDGTAFTEAFTTLAKRLKLWQYCARLDRLSGIGRYGVMMLGTVGVEDYQLTQPLQTVRRPEDVIYLGVYHEKNAQIQSWQMDTANPRFGLPEVYQLTVVQNNWDAKWTKSVALTVHHSRIIHVAEDLLQDDVYGRPRLQRSLNRLFDLDKVAASTGEAYWQLVSRILQAKIDPTAEIGETDLKELDEKLEEMVHDLRRQFTGQGVGLEWLGGQTPNVQQVADFYFSLIAGGAGIPKRILFGSELGQLASSTDETTYLGTINERQEQFAEPHILRAFIDRMIEIRALPKPTTGDYRIVWPTLFEESDKDQAEANYKRAQAASALTPVGGNPLELVEVDEDRNIWLVPRQPAPPPPETEPDESEILDEGGTTSGELSPEERTASTEAGQPTAPTPAGSTPQEERDRLASTPTPPNAR